MQTFLVISKQVKIKRVGSSTLLLSKDKSSIYEFEDNVSQFIINLLIKPKEFSDILNFVWKEFDVDLNTAKKDITNFIQECLDTGIIEKISK